MRGWLTPAAIVPICIPNGPCVEIGFPRWPSWLWQISGTLCPGAGRLVLLLPSPSPHTHTVTHTWSYTHTHTHTHTRSFLFFQPSWSELSPSMLGDEDFLMATGLRRALCLLALYHAWLSSGQVCNVCSSSGEPGHALWPLDLRPLLPPLGASY